MNPWDRPRLDRSSFSSMRVIADMHCPTWRFFPHEGWRGFLIKKLRMPKRWFKPERKERVMYSFGNMIVCSPESCQEVMAMLDKGGGKVLSDSEAALLKRGML